MNTAVLLEQNPISGKWRATWLDPHVGMPVKGESSNSQADALRGLADSLDAECAYRQSLTEIDSTP